jgi:deoxyribonuclease V
VLDGIPGLGLLVIDGYADLDPDGSPGLGAHADTEFTISVIGVAKSAFRTATHAIAVRRGTSARPVFVTAAGMSRTDAACLVQNMADRFRIPDALRRADTLARTGPPDVTRPATTPAKEHAHRGIMQKRAFTPSAGYA